MSSTALNERYQLEIEFLRLQRQVGENDAALRQAKSDLREAKVAEAEYGGSFRSFRDKLTGRKEETETALRHGLQKAEAALASAQRKKEILDARLPELKETLAALPEWNSLNDGTPEWYRLEALYCAEALLPLVEINRELLTERRNQFNGSYAGQIKTWHELSDIYSAPEKAGEACKPYILRLQAALDPLGVPFELHSYFREPTAFLSSATQYTRMDRINEAIGQTEKIQKRLSELQKQLED